MRNKRFVIGHIKGLHFHRNVREMRANQIEHFFKVIGMHTLVGFAGNQQHMIVTHAFNYGNFLHNLHRV
ncbi:hypothetical protein D3C73_780360 [compost metagenome]